jgi:hypothetical protein
MVLRGATSLRGALEGVGHENRAFFGPEMARAKRSDVNCSQTLECGNWEQGRAVLFLGKKFRILFAVCILVSYSILSSSYK